MMLKFAIKKSSKDIFHDAVASKDTSRLKFLLQNNRLGFEVDELDDDGLTALQRSCFIGNLKLVQLLVTYGANIHIQDREGWSVLHASAVAGNYSIVRYLVYMGADVAVRNDLGQLPIDLANDLYCIVILLEAMVKAGHNQLIGKYFSKRPSLKAFIENKLRELSQANQDNDISLDSSRNTNGENNSTESQLSLVLNSVTSDEESENTSLSVDSLEDLWSTLNKEKTVRLNEGGGKPESAEILEDKETPKRAVCTKCQGKKRYSSVSSSSSDSSTSSYDSAYSSLSLHSENPSLSGSNPVKIETSQEEAGLYCDLLRHTLNSPKRRNHHHHHHHNCKKKDKYNKPRSNSSPSRFTSSRRSKLLEQIKEHQDDVNALNSSGLSLLHVTACQGDAEIVQMLLDKGAEVNRQSLKGRSPLHEAAKSGDLDCVVLLLSYGGDMFADDDNGLLPIDLAEDRRIKLLLHRAMAIK